MITFNLPTPEDLSSYRYLSFRISQTYSPTYPGTDKDIAITIRSYNPTQAGTVLLSDYGELLHAPIPAVVNPTLGNPKDISKNAMRTFMIPLQDFPIDHRSIGGVSFDFSVNSGNGERFIIDDIEFVK